MVGRKLADNECGEPGGRSQRQGDDKTGAEPVLLLALIQHDLQGAHADNQHPQAPQIDAHAAAVEAEIGRIVEEQRDHEQAGQPDRQVDIEHPAPRVRVGEPAAQGRSQDRGGHDAQPPKSHSLAAFPSGKLFEEHGLGKRLQTAAGGALQDAEEDQRRQIRRQSAEHA